MSEPFTNTSDDVIAAASRMRRVHLDMLSRCDIERVIAVLGAVADLWRTADSPWRARAGDIGGIYGLEGTARTLDALLESMRAERLRALVDGEGVRNRPGFPVVGHVLASNTPLLGWTSIIRALLVRSASVVKLPTQEGSAPICAWTQLFVESLEAVDPPLATTVRLLSWEGGTEPDAAMARVVDLTVVYGSDNTIEAWRTLRDGLPFVGYGHRVSFGLVMDGADFASAADGFALDVLLFDQTGCLSPHVIYVEGDYDGTAAFAEQLALGLDRTAPALPDVDRTGSSAPSIGQARSLARMEAGTRVWEGDALRWTVIARRSPEFALSPGYGVIYVAPIGSIEGLPAALAPVVGMLQGCAVAGAFTEDRVAGLASPCFSEPKHGTLIGDGLLRLGVSYVCAPGQLQTPPLSWPEDGRPILRSLLP